MNKRQILIGSGALTLAGAGAAYFGLRRIGSMGEYNTSVAATRAAMPSHPESQVFIRYATLAASSHNTQPWRFQIRENRIDILPDLARRTPVVDPDDHHLFVSLGCAAENLILAGEARGHRGQLSFDPANNGSLSFDFVDGPPASSALFDAIPLRQSTRAEYDGRPVSATDLGKLTAAASIPGVDLILITERKRLEQVRDLVVAGNSAQLADPGFVEELKTWLRFSPLQAIETGDGLFSVVSVRHCRHGLGRMRLNGSSAPKRITRNMRGSFAPPLASPSSFRSAKTASIGFSQGAHASVSRCKPPRSVSSTPLSISRSKWQGCDRSWRASSECQGVVPTSSCDLAMVPRFRSPREGQ